MNQEPAREEEKRAAAYEFEGFCFDQAVIDKISDANINQSVDYPEVKFTEIPVADFEVPVEEPALIEVNHLYSQLHQEVSYHQALNSNRNTSSCTRS